MRRDPTDEARAAAIRASVERLSPLNVALADVEAGAVGLGIAAEWQRAQGGE